MAAVDDLVRRIDHPEEDDDGTEVYLLVEALVAEGDRALPADLVRAAAKDLGDDQDGLTAEILDLIEASPARAQLLIEQLCSEPYVRTKAIWASQFLPHQ